MKLGIVGLPNVGKSTLFNAMTSAGAAAANYPFCTIDPNVGIVPVPDARLDRLAAMYSPDKVTPAVIEFVDIAGLVRGASKGEGLGNQFLSHIREVDAIVHVVRCFENSDISHVDGAVDALRDIETIQLELILSDLDIVSRRADKAGKLAKGDRAHIREAELFEELHKWLDGGRGASAFVKTLGEADAELVCAAPLLSNKKVLYAANMSEEDFTAGYEGNEMYKSVLRLAEEEGARVIPVCAKLEEEISELDAGDKGLFLEELGLKSSGLDRLVASSYDLLGLMSFLTAGKPEVRAWTIKEGTKAPAAAGVIHSDFERGFIRAEVVSFSDLTACGSLAAAKEKGLVRSEGREYVMRDGDVVLFRFNV